jgi:L-rhamnose-H+ transport protein
MQLALGVLLVIAGGALEGLFSLPVTRTPRWQWENIWGLGSLVALLLVPWPVALATVPELRQVYADVRPDVLGLTFLFGLGWGLGGIFWGKAIAAVGMALGVSLLMGLINVFSSPVPLAINEPHKLIEPGGLVLLAAVGVMITGVVICAVAGRLRQRDLGEGSATGAAGTAFTVGLVFCVASGILSAMVNVGFIFGEPIAAAAERHGASPVAKSNAIWALVFTGNYLVNSVYALALMARRRTFGLIVSAGSPRYWAWVLFMGITWPLGIVLYGIGAGKMGPYGAYVAFPMMLVMAILFGNLAGLVTGEWRGTSPRTRGTMVVGVLVLCLAFGVFGTASHLLGD